MNFLDVFVKTLADQKINTAIISSIAIILLGYFCRKKIYLKIILQKYLQMLF